MTPTIARLSLVSLALLASCARGQVRGKSAPPESPALIVFGAADVELCSTDPATDDLTRAEDALARGCAAEALKIAESGLATEAAGPRAHARLVAAQARRLAMNEGLTLHGGPGLAFPYIAFDARVWTGAEGPPPEAPILGGPMERSALRMVATLQQDVDAAITALARGDLPPTVMTDGRLAQLAVTAVQARNCLDSRIPEDLGPTYREGLRSMREQTMIAAGLQRAEGGREVAALARAAVADCDLQTAVGVFQQAAELLHAEGSRTLAVQTALEAVETASFLGGRADTFVSGEATPDALTELASLQEAGWAGFGAFHESALQTRTMVDQVFAEFPKEARDPAVRAQARALLAIAAIRLQGDADAAREYAEQAITDAVVARRADLVDLARVALVLAYAQQDRPDHAAAIVDALDRSFVARGTEGARVHVSRVLRSVAAIEAERGRSAEAVALLQLGRRLYPRLSSAQERAMILRTLPMVLRDSGRVEEAIEVFDWARDRWADESKTVEKSFWSAMDRQFVDERASLQGQVGIDTTTATQMDTLRALGIVDLMDALARNDAAAVRSALRAASPEQRVSVLAVAPQLGLCHAFADDLVEVIDVLQASTDGAAEMLSATVGSNETAMRTEVRMTVLETGTSLLPSLAFACGPWLAEQQVARLVTLAERSYAVAGLGPLTGADRSMYDGVTAHVAGRLDEGRQAYVRAAQQATLRAGLSAATALGLGDMIAPLHTRAAQLALRLGRIEEALAILEQGRSFDLRASRQRAQSSGASPLGELVAIERKIDSTQARARSIAQMLTSVSDPKTRLGLEAAASEQSTAIERLQAERDRAVRTGKEKHGTAYRAAALAPPSSVSELQRALSPDETLVYYVTQTEEAWAIVIDREEAKAIELPAIDAKTKLPRLATALASYSEDARLRSGRGLTFKADTPRETTPPSSPERTREELHRALVEPVLSAIPSGRRVIVVPDPLLAEIPFAALGSADAPWILRNPLRVLPGAYMLAGDDATREPTGDVVVFGDPEFVVGAAASASARTAAGEVAWERLPFTRVEAKSVAALYRSRPIVGSKATEAAVRELAPTARILHIASHGLANTRRPDYSAIVLATPERGSTDDGILHAYEVERMRVGAEIVVLSACQTGLGQVRGAEGMMALDRAFLVAGAGAVVSSLWTVDDASTELLLRSFHESLRAGEPADVALAVAMRRVRESPKWRDPFYWSAFRVVGTGARQRAQTSSGARRSR